MPDASQYVDELIAEVDDRTRTESARYVDDLLAASFVPMRHTDHTAEFESAVATLTEAGIPRASAVALTNHAVTRGLSLAKWSGHLVADFREKVTKWGR